MADVAQRPLASQHPSRMRAVGRRCLVTKNRRWRNEMEGRLLRGLCCKSCSPARESPKVPVTYRLSPGLEPLRSRTSRAGADPTSVMLRNQPAADAEVSPPISLTPWGRQAVMRPRYICSTCTFEARSEEHTSELQSLAYIVCRLLHQK